MKVLKFNGIIVDNNGKDLDGTSFAIIDGIVDIVEERDCHVLMSAHIIEESELGKNDEPPES